MSCCAKGAHAAHRKRPFSCERMKTFCIHNLPHLSVRWALDTHESGTGGGDGAKQKEKRDGTYKSGDWTAAYVRGKERLRKGWAPWFAHHGNFRFTDEDTFIDEMEQKVLYRWRLDWPSLEKGYEGQPETRRGVDLLHLKDGKVIEKLTYSKTTVEIDGKRIPLSPQAPQ